MIYKTMEDYVDDTLTKYMERKTHLTNLRPILDWKEKFKLRLNPKKCAFRFISIKLLGYIMSIKGIKVDPKKVKAIMDIQSPQNISQIRGLQENL